MIIYGDRRSNSLFTWYWGFSICLWDFFSSWGLLKVVFFLWCCVGRKNSNLRVRNIHQTSEAIPNSYLMASEQEYPEFNRNLFPHIEPYSTGLLKVSDLHTIYWEQSGNPNGHVSSNCFIGCLNMQNLFIVWSLTFETVFWACMHINLTILYSLFELADSILGG